MICRNDTLRSQAGRAAGIDELIKTTNDCLVNGWGGRLVMALGHSDWPIGAAGQTPSITFTLYPGETATVTADGSWITNPHDDPTGGACDALGNGVPNHGQYPCRGPEGCMVILRGPAITDPEAIPAPSLVGWFTSLTMPFDDPGLYWFVANDDDYSDNSGIITLHVDIDAAPAPSLGPPDSPGEPGELPDPC
jgi:hypothetical protein